MSTLKHFVLNVNTCCLIYIYIYLLLQRFKNTLYIIITKATYCAYCNAFNVISLYIVYLLLQILHCDVHCLYVFDILVHFLMIAMHIYV
jgi:hypothetical protein